ncbi:MAG: hypothetical protein QGF36_05940, partial [Candidatus Marinimicrobia bacterium]|nr:hypothetical protein [Candidatus Neomarinimicrobiota bacterium]
MKNINIIALIIALLMTGINQLKGGEYSPMDVKTITLKNGLTVYLNEDHNTTSVFGAVIVNGGGKRDPQDATGIAHYLEQ